MTRFQKQAAGCICAGFIGLGATVNVVSDVSGGSTIETYIVEGFPSPSLDVFPNIPLFDQDASAEMGTLFNAAFGADS